MNTNKLREYLECTSIKSVQDAIDIYKVLLKTNENSESDFHILFRGQQKYCWKLNSGLALNFNCNESESKLINLEKAAIYRFSDETKEQIREPISNKEFCKEWDIICQAQHAGVKTTLVDVTAHVLISLFFATEYSCNQVIEASDAALWCLLIPEDKTISGKDVFGLSPYSIEKNVVVFNPCLADDLSKRLYEKRISSQKGGFFAINENDLNKNIEDLEDFKSFLFKIRIPQQFKNIIREELTKEHICRKTMYVYEDEENKKLSDKINKEFYNS